MSDDLSIQLVVYSFFFFLRSW